MERRDFLRTSLCTTALGAMGLYSAMGEVFPTFADRLQPVGRILETPGYYVWGCSPIFGPDGRVHVFYSRWQSDKGMGGWINRSEIAHAVADQIEGPYIYQSTILAPQRDGSWDSTTCHNPHIQFLNGKYYLFYMGNSNGRTHTKRIGVAIADDLNGPWERPIEPLLEAGPEGAWDDHCTTNPSFVQRPDGKCLLYYKSWGTDAYENYTDPKIRGNRKYGLALADQPEGPYTKYEGNPIIDYSDRGGNAQAEDAFVWFEEGKFHLIMRDMGVYNHQYGLYLQSDDGLNFEGTSGKPEIAYYETDRYFKQGPAPGHLSKFGRFERPQLLMKAGKPQALFVTTQGGAYQTSSPFVFRLQANTL